MPSSIKPGTRRMTRAIKIGSVVVGSNNPIAIQSMTNEQDPLDQIIRLENAGVEIVRVSVPDESALKNLPRIRKATSIPLVADIHYDHRLAVSSAPFVDKIRINPGTMKRYEEVVEAAKKQGIPIRIGVNAGSIEKDLTKRYNVPQALFESVKRNVGRLEKLGFNQIILSAKVSNIPYTVAVHEMIAEEYDYPVHIGITEAGPMLQGTIKSSAGLGILLKRGIGDTVRVSLTEDPITEVKVAQDILQYLGLRTFGPEVISCPTCARTRTNIEGVVKEVEERIKFLKKPLKIAIMGCSVNGPGEARHADVGVACGDEAVIFKEGKVIRKVTRDEIVDALMEQVSELCESKFWKKSLG
ncbi:MAG: flavodoxin-dependent (E)-4-hydroxy-3-methylbut-2-enyl-diphosphate synthase [Nanobdellota archaeon]